MFSCTVAYDQMLLKSKNVNKTIVVCTEVLYDFVLIQW